ncbi:MAG: DNA-3-methyladenine glycosylase [Thermoleophilia bacterium]|nr:DNA-3-methyladenine glycosylase [Thermoleophilia bacterium]
MSPAEEAPELGDAFFARPVGEVADDLIGCELIAGDAAGIIVEVERYEESDPASHSHRGPTPRAAVMFGPPGHLYVYRSYGMHWCLNLVCEPEGRGAAVLVRALAPTRGIERMRARRPRARADRDLCAGPGRLTEALGIDGTLNGRALGGEVRVHARRGAVALVRGPRIGISRAVERPWRVGLAGSGHLSRPFPAPAEAR